MEEEAAHEPYQTHGGRIPLGVRLTVHFLNVAAVLLLLPLLGLGFFCLMLVWPAARSAGAGFGECVLSGLCLSCFLVVLGLLLGALWMGTLLCSRYPLDYPRTWPPAHPARSIARPLFDRRSGPGCPRPLGLVGRHCNGRDHFLDLAGVLGWHWGRWRCQPLHDPEVLDAMIHPAGHGSIRIAFSSMASAISKSTAVRAWIRQRGWPWWMCSPTFTRRSKPTA